MPHQDSPHVCSKCGFGYCHVCELWCPKCGNKSVDLNQQKRHEMSPKHQSRQCTCFIKPNSGIS